jgi:hypothetical protein
VYIEDFKLTLEEQVTRERVKEHVVVDRVNGCR